MAKRKFILLLIIVVLQAGDLLSTKAALNVPGVVELNPFVRCNGLLDIKLYVLFLAFLLIWYKWDDNKQWHLWGLCGVYSLIVASNVLLALK